MAREFTMPKLGLTMEEATIIEWLVPDGGELVEGDAALRIETDKVETEVEAPASGVLHRVGKEGDVYPCGAVIAFVLAEGEAAPAPSAKEATGAPRAAQSSPTQTRPVVTRTAAGGRQFVSPNARRIASATSIDVSAVLGTGPGGRVVAADVIAYAGQPRHGDAPPASAAARTLADLLGIDLGEVSIDPIERRVTREGVALYARTRLQNRPSVAEAKAPSMPLLQEPTRTIRMTGMRGTIAKRMHASLQSMAQLTLTMDADMSAVVADRERRKQAGSPPGYTDYVVAAAARALAAHPDVNSQVTDDGIAVLPDIHVGLAVALDNGLLVPVVRHADRLTLQQLSAETTRLAQAARSSALAPAELEGATFSVSALGMFGVDVFTPVINPPNAAILGVGRLRDDVVVIDGEVATVKRLTLSLTWDHRVIDGAPAAEFCRTIVELLADPTRLD